MKYILIQGSGGKRTLLPVASVDFAIEADVEVTVYLKSGRTLTVDKLHGSNFVDALCAAMNASAPPKGGE